METAVPTPGTMGFLRRPRWLAGGRRHFREYVLGIYILEYSSHCLNTTIMLGKGAAFTASPNFNLPLINRISFAFGSTIS